MSVSAVFITCGKNLNWFDTLAAIDVPVHVVTHDFKSEKLNHLTNVRSVMSWLGEFHWGSLANIAARSTKSDWLLFLHDDVVPPTKAQLELMVEQAQEAKACMVLPTLHHDKICGQQCKPGKGWSDLTELSANCIALIKREELVHLGGFPSFQQGQSFDIPHIQILFWKHSLRTIVSHGVVVHHEFGASWGQILTIEQRRRETMKASRWSFRTVGIEIDMNERLRSPRLVHRNNGPQPIVKFNGYVEIGEKRLSNPPDQLEHLLEEVSNISDYDSFTIDGKLYHRYAEGDRFVVVSEKKEFSFSCHRALGLGDCFFIMKAAAAIKQAMPNCRISISTDLAMYDLLVRCRDIDSVKRASWTQTDRRTSDIHRFHAFGMEDGPKKICDGLGLNYDGQIPNYNIRDEDLVKAKGILIAHGWTGKPLIGIQSNGGWISKRWAHTQSFIRQALQRGYEPWIVGTERSRRWRFGIEGIIDTGPLPLPVLVAALSLCEVVVGFDSGGVHAAAAVQVPIVSMWGPHDPVRMILDASVYNVIAVRKKTPYDCGTGNCRATTGGSICPLRQGSPGGDCLDEIKPSEIWKYVEEVTGHSRW